MRFSHEKITALRIGWNERPLTETDFHRLCRKYKIKVEEMPLSAGGFYYRLLGKDFIAIDSKLSHPKKLFVMFHEFAHFLMHAPGHNATANFHGVGKQTRYEREADAFALVALIPRAWLETRTPDELIADEGITAAMLRERVELFRRHGV